MCALSQLSFEGKNKIETVIERLQTFEPPKAITWPFRGVNDSVTIYRLAEMAGVQFDAHYNITTVDPPELVRFIRDQYPAVERHRPEMTMWELMRHEKIPPLHRARFCCRALKETGGEGRVIVTGVRWAESPRRAKRHMTEQCHADGSKVFVHPIIDWTDGDVWEFIKGYDVPYCGLYDEGFKRLGCVLCPMTYDTKTQIERWPRIAAQYRRVFDQLYHLRTERGDKLTWESGADWFHWWVSRRSHGRSEAQPVLFE